MESAARSVKLSSLIDWTLSSGGIMRGNNLATWIDTVTAGVPIEKFPIRFAAVATDLQSEQAVLLDSGSAGRCHPGVGRSPWHHRAGALQERPSDRWRGHQPGTGAVRRARWGPTS